MTYVALTRKHNKKAGRYLTCTNGRRLALSNKKIGMVSTPLLQPVTYTVSSA